MDKITPEKLDKYFNVTQEALNKIKIKDSNLNNINSKKIANEFLDMATRYFNDAKYFKEKNDLVTAFAALNYAHGWLDAGAKLGVFDVKDSKLFVLP